MCGDTGWGGSCSKAILMSISDGCLSGQTFPQYLHEAASFLRCAIFTCATTFNRNCYHDS